MKIVKCDRYEAGWYECGECGTGPHERLVMVGEEPEWDSATVWLCRDCLKKALDLFTEGK